MQKRLPKEGAVGMGMTGPLELEMAIISFAWGPMYCTKPRFLHQRDASGSMASSGASRSRCPTRMLVIGARGACLHRVGTMHRDCASERGALGEGICSPQLVLLEGSR